MSEVRSSISFSAAPQAEFGPRRRAGLSNERRSEFATIVPRFNLSSALVVFDRLPGASLPAKSETNQAMYLPPQFSKNDTAHACQLMRAYPLANLISNLAMHAAYAQGNDHERALATWMRHLGLVKSTPGDN